MVMTTYGGKNVFLKNLTNSRFEPACIVKQQPSRWSDNLKKQHFKYGEAAGASSNNRLVYGSLEDDKRIVNTEPRIKRYYTQPASDSLPYNKDDFSKLHNDNKLTNMFSLEERSSAEIKKKAREAKEVGEDRVRYLKEKEQHELARMKEKKEDLELLMNYKEPWGKPGAGAPKSTNMRTNAVQKLSDSREQVLPLGKPGGGAPMRTDSGKLKTKTGVDPEIRFQKRERGQVIDVVGPDAKYPTENPLVTNLDILAKKTREERHVVKRDEESNDNKQVPENHMNYQYYDPFGRPGGGAPTKDKNGNILAKRTFNLVTTIQEGDPQEETNKFKNRPKWDAYLKKQTLKKDGERQVNRQLQQKYNEELDEIAREKIERRQEDILRERKESLQHANTWNSFWGRPGNGAPLSENGRKKKVELFDPLNNKLLM